MLTQLLQKNNVESTASFDKKAISTTLLRASKGHCLVRLLGEIDLTAAPMYCIGKCLMNPIGEFNSTTGLIRGNLADRR